MYGMPEYHFKKFIKIETWEIIYIEIFTGGGSTHQGDLMGCQRKQETAFFPVINEVESSCMCPTIGFWCQEIHW